LRVENKEGKRRLLLHGNNQKGIKGDCLGSRRKSEFEIEESKNLINKKISFRKLGKRTQFLHKGQDLEGKQRKKRDLDRAGRWWGKRLLRTLAGLK